MIDETIYIVTATGVCIDTEVKPFRNPQQAKRYVNDLKTSYGDANRVDEIDDLKTATPATNKIIAPNTQVQATGTTWYAVWADID